MSEEISSEFAQSNANSVDPKLLHFTVHDSDGNWAERPINERSIDMGAVS